MVLRDTDSLALRFVAFGSTVLLSVEPAFATETTVVGYWKHVNDETGETQSIFKLYERQGKLVGRIEKTFSTPESVAQKIASELSGTQKGNLVVGSTFFWGFVRDTEDPNKWVDGKVMDPADGRVYDAEAELSEDGETLKVLGSDSTKGGGSSVWRRLTAAELKGL
jgi:uncharacterized protein (DUF2147 family)